MARFLKNRTEATGLPPGTLTFIGKQKMEHPEITVTDYAADFIEEIKIEKVSELSQFSRKETRSWINVNGVHDTNLIAQIGDSLGIDPLALEDVVNTGQRPILYEFDKFIFIAIKMLHLESETGMVKAEHLSIIVGDEYLLTFQEQRGDVFNPIRDRLKRPKGRLRNRGMDYLAYAMLDVIVDNYIIVIEELGDNIEELENTILSQPSPELLEQINNYKREINYLRKSIRPAREMMFQLSKLDSDIISKDTEPFLKDLLDLVTLTVEITDTYRDMLSDMLNIYHTNVTSRLNEIMRILTMFTVIFVPLTFIAGVYGTNFEYFPELKYPYAYPIFWGVLAVVALGMIWFFRRQKWL